MAQSLSLSQIIVSACVYIIYTYIDILIHIFIIVIMNIYIFIYTYTYIFIYMCIQHSKRKKVLYARMGVIVIIFVLDAAAGLVYHMLWDGDFLCPGVYVCVNLQLV